VIAALPHALSLVGLGLIGAVIGSFLNVVIHRLPVMIAGVPDDGARYDLALPPSACPSCGHRLRPWENLPLLSYLLLRGRCSACAAPIGWRYPVVEGLAAAAGPLLTLHFGLTEPGLAVTVFVWFAIAITAIDLRHLLIPDLLSLPLLWLGLLISTRSILVPPDAAILGAAAGYLTFLAISQVGTRLSGHPVMGEGDLKLFAALGAWIGWSHLPQAMLIASLLGSGVGIALVLVQRQDRSQPLPFGPFLLAGGIVTLLWGNLLSNLVFGSRG
jgi:leader peptidase (prepilin peptidase)/N-methyltransferase